MKMTHLRSSLSQSLGRPISYNLRAKVTLAVVLPLLLILGTFTVIEYRRQQDMMLNNLSVLASHSGQVIESTLRQAMLENNRPEVQTLLDAIGQSGQFRVVYLLNTSGEVIFAPDREGVGLHLDNQQADCAPCHLLPVAQRPKSVVVTSQQDGERVFRSMYPILNRPECHECHDSNSRLLGLLLTDIPTAPMESTLGGELRENLVWWAATILITVLVVNLVLSRFVLRRLERLTTAIVGVGEGRSASPLPEGQPDEIGQLSATFNMMARQVQDRDQENHELSESLRRQSAQRGDLLKRLITAQENERHRVARELHDELGQSLSGLALRARLLEKYIDSDSGRPAEQLAIMHDLIRETTDRMYDLILDLRPSVLDDLGLAAALRNYAERALDGSGIAFEMDTSGLTRRPPPEIETTVYRIFQEALSNVLRHAEASQVAMTLTLSDGIFDGTIVDNGRGFEPDSIPADGNSPRGMGLAGMQERVAQCCGSLEIDSRPGAGTRLQVRIPLTGEECCD